VNNLGKTIINLLKVLFEIFSNFLFKEGECAAPKGVFLFDLMNRFFMEGRLVIIAAFV